MYFQRQLRDWFRVVLPHEGIVIGFVVLYLLTDVLQVLDEIANMPFNMPGGQNPLVPVRNPLSWENDFGAGLAITAAVLYGGFRVAFFHPFYRKDYREWLQTTPWSLGRRLPLGPIHVVWQDLFVLGVLMATTLRMSRPVPWAVPVAFLAAYFVVSMLPLLLTGESAIAFVMALLLGAVGRWVLEPAAVALLLAAVFVLCLVGLRRSMSRVHEWDLTWWHDQALTEIFSKNMANLAEANRKKILGWPYDRLSLKRNETPVRFRVGLCVCVLIGWWLHALLHPFAVQAQAFGRVPGPWGVSAMLTMPCLLLAGVRTGIYVWGYAPPIGLFARLVRFRWIIPGYDKVFVPPICILVLALYGPYAAKQMGIPWEYGVPLLVGLMLLVALTMPPSLDEWRLTGRHRIVPAMQAQQNELMQG